MVTIGCDDAILLRDRGLHAHGHGFLAVVEVAKSADQLGLVKRVRGYLHPPHRRHVMEECEKLLRAGVHGARRSFALMGSEWDGGFDSESSGVVRGGGDRTTERCGAG